MDVPGVHHAGVYVADLERSIAFYGELCGFEAVARVALGSERLASTGGRAR